MKHTWAIAWKLEALLLAVVVAVALVLGACSSGGSTFGVRDGGWGAGTTDQLDARVPVRITPPAGASAELAAAIARSVATHLGPLGVDAIVSDQPGNELFVLSASAEPNTDPAISYPVILSWLVTDANGRLIHSYALGVEGTLAEWDDANPDMVRAIGASTAHPMAAWMLAELGRAQVALPRGPKGGFGVLLTRIKGLSGADERALTQALKAALLRRDLLITEDPRQATYGLTGVVELSRDDVREDGADLPGEGIERVSITWRVFRGKRSIGRVVQESDVAEGKLNGNWAEVAPAVAEGAADSIIRILVGGGNTAFSAAQGSQPPQTSLPQVPGRGPPPPP